MRKEKVTAKNWRRLCVVGDTARQQIEVRYKEREHRSIDEVCAANARVHLEQMSESQYALIIETAKERACYWIGSLSHRAEVGVSESWRDPINRRAEAAKRRENAKR